MKKQIQNKLIEIKKGVLRMIKKEIIIKQVVTSPTIGERCTLLTKEGQKILTSTVENYFIDKTGAVEIETKNTIYRYYENSATCMYCDKICVHRGAYRRLPEKIGGLGLCPRLKGGM